MQKIDQLSKYAVLCTCCALITFNRSGFGDICIWIASSLTSMLEAFMPFAVYFIKYATVIANYQPMTEKQAIIHTTLTMICVWKKSMYLAK